ncbi:MAG: TldD/PmbA family protein [Myxococcota bacterium]|nr:TldD/PmbA family protein [Myxococcota bacterium]
MLNDNIARTVIDHALETGADFAELFVEQNLTSNLEFSSGDIESIQSGIDFGIGIRLFFGERVLYGYTNRTDVDELRRITTELVANQRLTTPKHNAPHFETQAYADRHESRTPLVKIDDLEAKIEYARRVDQAARGENEKISQVIARILQRQQNIVIFNSDGLHVADTRNYCRLQGIAVATDGTEQSNGHHLPGALKGWEFSDEVSPESIGVEAARIALVTLGADDCPSGDMPVVLGNGFGGVIFHEACGHLLETTSVAQKASVFHDQLGELIANPVVNAVDDGLMTGQWGSINIDDEGMQTKRTQLIKDGRLESFLVDKMGALKTGYERTGSGRRQSYRFAPASRMRNTFIEPGESSLDDMISSIDKGIYARTMGGGSVTPGTGEFNFSIIEPYLIENGKVSRPLKSATLISTGPDVLKRISMVGNDFKLAAGMCGSVSGAVPTTVGQPAIKVDQILVGGQA